MVALSVRQRAITLSKRPLCPETASHVRIQGRLLEGQREVRRWDEQRQLDFSENGITLNVHSTLWNELGLENTQDFEISLHGGRYRWTAPLSNERFDRPEASGDRDRLMAYGHGFQSVLEDEPTCFDPVYDRLWRMRLGVYGKPTVVRPTEGLVEVSWTTGTTVLKLRVEDIQAKEMPR